MQTCDIKDCNNEVFYSFDISIFPDDRITIRHEMCKEHKPELLEKMAECYKVEYERLGKM